MIENCGQCLHLMARLDNGMLAFGCSKKPNNQVVPQSSKHNWEAGEYHATFPRVPMWCPLPASKAHKQPSPPESQTQP